MAKARENNRQNPPRRRRRRRRMSLGGGHRLIIIALLVGALGGYLAGHGAQNGTLVERETQLANANSRIADLESALTMMGVDPNQEVFEDLTPLVEGATVGDLVGELTPVANNNALVEGGDMLAQSEDAQQEPQVVAEFDGVQVMSDEVLDVYNASVNSLLLNGQDVSEFADSLLEQALNTVVTDKIRYLKAEELGLTTLTAEDEAAIDAQAQAQYESYLEFYMFEGIDDETALAEAEERLAADGNSLEDLREQYAQDWWEQKLQDYVTADLTVTDEALEETYALYLEQQRDLYDADPAQYELARRYGGQTVTYNPEGYRTIKLIFLPFDTETSMRVSEINGKLFELAGGEDPDQIDQLEGELETYYAQLETTAEEILDRIAQGEEL